VWGGPSPRREGVKGSLKGVEVSLMVKDEGGTQSSSIGLAQGREATTPVAVRARLRRGKGGMVPTRTFARRTGNNGK